MYYLIYKITNTVTGKEYIGAHQTPDKDDRYMGSGKYLKRAIQKYGVDKFTREILFEFANKQDMFTKEAELVTEEYLSEANTYNLRVGGKGGFYNVSDEIEQKRLLELARYQQTINEKYRTDIDFRNEYVDNRRARLQKGTSIKILKRQEHPEFDLYCKSITEQARLASLSEESNQKRIQTFKEIGHQRGEKNSQFGSQWIHNPETSENKKISKDDLIPDGWIKGRKIKK